MHRVRLVHIVSVIAFVTATVAGVAAQGAPPAQAAPRSTSSPPSPSVAESLPATGLPATPPPQTESAARQVASASGDPFALALYYQRVGDYAKIGAGCVVENDVPSGCTAVGVPARLTNCPEPGIPA